MGVISLPTFQEIKLGELYRPSVSLRNELSLVRGDRFVYEFEGKRFRCEMVDHEQFKVIEQIPETNSFIKRKA